MTTLNSQKSPADICRENGWTPGTRIVGDEGFGPTVIEITAVGDLAILARVVSQNGKPVEFRSEMSWQLLHRDWRVVA